MRGLLAISIRADAARQGGASEALMDWAAPAVPGDRVVVFGFGLRWQAQQVNTA
jgi:hypothetical protein